MIKYPSIDQFRNVIRAVQNKARWAGTDSDGNPIFDRNKPLPTLKFRGTTKVHGTNASFVYDTVNDSFEYQSRERVLSLTADNAGFMLYMMSIENELREMVREYMKTIVSEPEKIVVYGEWCGGNIQKGVAITGLEKMFIVFGVKVIFDEEEQIEHWLNHEIVDPVECREKNIYSINTFGSWEIDIDFEHPEYAQNTMVAITDAVEKECPVGKFFGRVVGTDNTVGEGVVWGCVKDGWTGSSFRFKVKGEEHSVSKVKTTASIDVEAMESMAAFIESVVTENRMNQMLDVMQREKLLPFDMSSLGEYIRSVYNDVVKEEMDTIVANHYDPKKLGGPIANVARKWYINKFNEGV